jgi:hypothetical protein
MIGINGWSDHILNNDTIGYVQEFSNYYAYDDGSAENGYGLAGMNAKLAYRFSLNNSDTLGGVKFYFNQTLSSPFFKYFYIMVWSSLEPEVILYKSKRMAPQFGDSINAFVTYPVDDTTLILSGTFFIGWQQTFDDNLNVGYDRNTNSKTLTFFNVDGTWTSSAFDGSLMIRPVMGTSWQAKSKQQLPSSNDFLFVVYPNPAQGNEINIDLPENYNTFEDQENTVVEIFDLTGRRIKNLKYAQTTDISFLNKGVYFIRLTNFFRNEASTSRLVITR